MRRKFSFLVLLCCCLAGNASSQDLKIGDKAPAIHLPSPDGDTIALSSFPGKLVLIDFWATWCAPCVNEQPELSKLYKKYKDAQFSNGKGFEIFGVSLDNKKEIWTNAIQQLNLTWTQVSDLKFWFSPVAETYMIEELPFNVLIDGNGRILAKNLHGQDLDEFIGSMVESLSR